MSTRRKSSSISQNHSDTCNLYKHIDKLPYFGDLFDMPREVSSIVTVEEMLQKTADITSRLIGTCFAIAIYKHELFYTRIKGRVSATYGIHKGATDVDLTKRALSKSHILNEVIVAEDGQEALDYLFGAGSRATGDPAPLPALILLDLKLPKVDGHEVLRHIRASSRTKRLPVVILTSSREEQDIATSYDNGANSYIRKPVDFLRFAEAIKNLGLYWLVLNEPPPEVAQ